MKRLLLLLLAAAVSVNLCAIPELHRRPPERIRRTHPVKVCRKPKIQYPPWKVVAAGGAAAGTVIASYKVSNGVEEGIKTVAKEHPEEFSNTLSVLTWPLRWGLLILMCASGWWLWRKYPGNKNNERKVVPLLKARGKTRGVEKLFIPTSYRPGRFCATSTSKKWFFDGLCHA